MVGDLAGGAGMVGFVAAGVAPGEKGLPRRQHTAEWPANVPEQVAGAPRAVRTFRRRSWQLTVTVCEPVSQQ